MAAIKRLKAQKHQPFVVLCIMIIYCRVLVCDMLDFKDKFGTVNWQLSIHYNVILILYYLVTSSF